MSFWKNQYMYPLMVVLLFFLYGCSIKGTNAAGPSGTSKAGSQSQQKTLTMRITWKTYSGRGEAIQRIVDSYNSINRTDYKVVLADGDEDLKSIEGLIEGRTYVDIYVLPYRFVEYLGYKKKLEDLTKCFENEKDQFYDEIWNLGKVGENTYGIPWLGHSMALIYNKNLLEKAGVDLSSIKSLESLAAACGLVEEKTDAKGIGLVGADHNDVSWMVNQFIYGFGGTLVNPEGTEVTIDSEEAKAAIEFYKNTLGSFAQSTWRTDTGVEVMEYFRKQQVAFEIQGPWGITDIWKNGNAFETGVISLTDIGLCPEVGPMMLALQPQLGEEEKAAAVEFMRYMISEQAQEMIMDGEYSPEHDAYYPFRLPVRKDIADSIVFEKYPEFSVFLKGFSKPSIDVPVPVWQLIKDKYYAPGLHRVMTDGMPVDAFLKEIREQGNNALKAPYSQL